MGPLNCMTQSLNPECKHSDLPLSFGTDSEIQLLQDVPLYNDVMLPSTSDKLVLPLSPLPPSEPLHVTTTTSEDVKTEHYPPATCTSLAGSSEVGWRELLSCCSISNKLFGDPWLLVSLGWQSAGLLFPHGLWDELRFQTWLGGETLCHRYRAQEPLHHTGNDTRRYCWLFCILIKFLVDLIK